jgi:uncharacterized membrane protein
MLIFISYLLGLHIVAGTISLISGGIALASAKGKSVHRWVGKVYFLAMTIVFVSGLIIAAYRFNRFLILIGFLTYYSIFAGVRALQLKQLHQGQRARWYDWAAGGVNGIANVCFLLLGVYLWIKNGWNGGVMLSIGFGIGGLMLTYVNLQPFVRCPKRANHWYTSHLANMTGSYIAALTSFLSTMVAQYEFMDPLFAFALPSILGVPLLIYWTYREDRRYDALHKKG